MSKITPQPKDITNTPLQGTLNGIPHVQNIITSSGVWYPVVLEYEDSKQLLIQPRARQDWLFSTASGSNYFTMRDGAALKAPIVSVSGTTLFWVMSNHDTIFEVLIGT